MNYSPRNMFYKKPLAASITAALVCLATAGQVQAKNFTLGNFDISFDSTFSYGQSWRVRAVRVRVPHRPPVAAFLPILAGWVVCCTRSQ